MKIVSWNINGYRAITGQNTSKGQDNQTNNLLFDYIYSENPDIICLQETKCSPDQIRSDLYAPKGYQAFYNWSKIKKGYSGVATFTKIQPTTIITDIQIEKFDVEGRILHTDFDEFTLLNIYFPNGSSGQARIDYKLEFYDAIFKYTNNLQEQGKKIIMCGDYNTAHKEIDLARPKENENSSGFLPIEREKIDWMVNNGWIDTFRFFNTEPNQYTWWDLKTRARTRNIGWRIDYHFITNDLLNNLKAAKIEPDILGSDHCPVVVELSF
jgi:exodeoxyribonuclease-3